ncbi:MAG: hypothetical protein HOC63_06395 [Rhodospirillales bacterium]|jgi:hemerythrin-like metal-binding protein/PAS domain S-box-containing protein|nr:hypothetical protein [Rhodospirillales bacterium]MBT4040685.1 hypothetical protein [Rhodospirillales bacterium]MBT4626306.1 hypothetical protein [Rhodospirillales bacterium]MBT5353027.1 hypothetical protein [Rhodospirillales bacterium]MBT5520504.1 hypothetical protein [Rhodospirillales bacterium]
MTDSQRRLSRRSWPSVIGTDTQRAARGLSRLEDITRLISEWVWESDPHGTITFTSGRITEKLGILPVQVVGKPFSKLGIFLSDSGEKLEIDWSKPFRDKLFQAQDKSGAEKLFLISGIPFYDPETGIFEGASGIAEDITERINSENELIQAQNKLEDRVVERTHALEIAKNEAQFANQAKSDFLSTISHELRTPLNAIIGFSDLIKYQIHGPVSPPKYQSYVDDINESGSHLLTLINGILDMSKIEAGEYTVFVEDFAPSEVIAEVLSMLEGQANENQLSLSTEFPQVALMVKADRTMTKQILINLVTNAIKFTLEGGNVVVRMSLVGENVVVNVTDSGIGMSPEELERALEPFVQIEREKGRFHEGTGLGLSLCNHFAELQGGRFSLQSEPGKGTTATFTLPSRDPDAVETVDAPSWLPSMSIGIKKWDSDHIALLDLIVTLQDSEEGNDPPEARKIILETLIRYVDIHLASEEFVMKRLDYPKYDAHKSRHDEFRAWMKKLQATPLDSPDDWQRTIVADALLEWWYNHILKDDMGYKTFFDPRRADISDLLADYKGIQPPHPQ